MVDFQKGLYVEVEMNLRKNITVITEDIVYSD